MNATTHRFALHLDVANQLADLISITLGAGVASHDVAGLRFGPLQIPLQEFVSHALNLSYGDADAVLMGLEMQGKDEGWFDMGPEEFAALGTLPFRGLSAKPFAGHRCVGDRLLATIDTNIELDLTPMFALPIA